MIRVKDDSIRLHGLVPQMLFALLVADQVLKEFGVDECVVTSANDGKHSPNSLHSREGLCRAVDVRCHQPELNGLEIAVRNEIKLRVGRDFDVVVEAVGGMNEHLHIEWDPK